MPALAARRVHWLGLCLGALAAASLSCHHEALPRPESGPPRRRSSGVECDFLADYPPPAARVEVVDPAAHAKDGCTWVDGYWQWGSRRWVWVPGEWLRVPRSCHLSAGDARWQDGPGPEPKLCVRYPELVDGRDGSRCRAAPCVAATVGSAPSANATRAKP